MELPDLSALFGDPPGQVDASASAQRRLCMRHHASQPNPLDWMRFNPTQPRYAHAISYIMESPPHSMIKCPRTSPTYETPIRPHKRRSFREVAEKENLLLPQRKLLSPSTELERESASKGPGNWDYEEVKALVMFFFTARVMLGQLTE